MVLGHDAQIRTHQNTRSAGAEVANGVRHIGFVPTAIIMLVLMTFCVYTMWLTGRNCVVLCSMQLDRQWSMAVGKRTAWLPTFLNMVACFGDNLAFTCFFGEIFAEGLRGRNKTYPRA